MKRTNILIIAVLLVAGITSMNNHHKSTSGINARGKDSIKRIPEITKTKAHGKGTKFSRVN